MKKRYVLKNRKRFFGIIFTLTLLLVTLLFATNAYGYKETTYKEITVRSGDSLWTLAEKYGSSSDIRKSVYQIKKINHLSSSDIYTGAVLKVPEE